MSKRFRNIPESKSTPNLVGIEFQAALALHQRGLLAEAKLLYEKILTKQPNHFDSLHLLGVIFKDTGQTQRGIDLIDQAIKIYPNNAAFYSNRGLALNDLKQFDAAIASYDKAIQLKPDYAAAHSNRGNALKAAKQFDAAIASYDKALQYTERSLYKGLSTAQVFTKIYAENHWGRSTDPTQAFFSGSGSHDPIIVNGYVEAVRKLLSTFEEKPSVVDLGCGDFSIGSRIRDLCNQYIACDIVEPLILFNRKKYKELNVDFMVLDLTVNELPKADLVFIRQVLQHLPNDLICNAVEKISSSYKYLVLTEHLPKIKDFQANLDKPAGRGIRLPLQSGIVLTKPPFNLKFIAEEQLYEIKEGDGIIRTTLYQF